MRKQNVPFPEQYVKALILTTAHLGGTTTTDKYEPYIYGRRNNDKIHLIDLDAMWDKLVIAARLFVSIENPADIVVASNKSFGRKAVLKFCEVTGATPLTGRFTPGSFTNQEIKGVKEPRLVLVSDPFCDRQTVSEASCVNTPCIAFCNTDNDLSLIDVAIPMNNRSPLAIGAGFFILAKIINYIKGKGNLEDDIKKEIELFFYRDPTELEQLAEEQKMEERAQMAMEREDTLLVEKTVEEEV